MSRSQAGSPERMTVNRAGEVAEFQKPPSVPA